MPKNNENLRIKIEKFKPWQKLRYSYKKVYKGELMDRAAIRLGGLVAHPLFRETMDFFNNYLISTLNPAKTPLMTYSAPPL